MPDEVLSMVLEYAALQAPRKDDNAHEDKKSIVSTVQGGDEALSCMPAFPGPYCSLFDDLEARIQWDGQLRYGLNVSLSLQNLEC